MSDMNPIENARGILGEHMTCYTMLCIDPKQPDTLNVSYDNRYAAIGMLERAIDILRENVIDDGWEIVDLGQDEDEE